MIPGGGPSAILAFQDKWGGGSNYLVIWIFYCGGVGVGAYSAESVIDVVGAEEGRGDERWKRRMKESTKGFFFGINYRILFLHREKNPNPFPSPPLLPSQQK